MKITALMPDALIKNVNRLAGGANTTESLLLALSEWVASKQLDDVIQEISKKPLRLGRKDAALRVRLLNRKRT
jgi:hypothetical protein